MKSIIRTSGSYSVGQRPEPGDTPEGCLVVEVHAVPLTELDVGASLDTARFGASKSAKWGLGSAFSGTVLSCGSGCKRLSQGDTVFGMVMNPFGDSCVTSRIIVSESSCAKCPMRISPAEAASMVVDLMVAERTLRLVKATDADSILVTGGTTPVARALIELAKSSMFGVEWIATTVNGLADREYAESLGADETFDTSCSGGDWSRAFESGVNRKEYDIVIDVVGDSKRAKRLLKPSTGRLVSLFNKPTPEELLDFDRRVSGNFLSSWSKRMLENRMFRNVVAGCSGRRRKCRGKEYFSVLPTGDGEILERLAVLIDMEVLSPKIEKSITPEEVSEAVAELRARPFSTRGRIVVEL